MRILLYGTSQTMHIKEVLMRLGIETVDMKYFKNSSRLKKLFLYFNELKNIDSVYRVYGEQRIDWKLLVGRLLGKLTITHWIGTDVIDEIQNYKSISSRINRFSTKVHVSGSSLLKKELMDVGINSQVVPIVPVNNFGGISEMPSSHSVLVYAPEGKEEFYGMPYVKELAIKFPDVTFNIVGNSDDYLKLENVKFHGTLSSYQMQELYNNITILFRFPKHDGLSMMLLEALSKGKQIIYSYSFPYTHTPKSRNIEHVIDCFDEVVKKEPYVNVEGANYVKKEYDQEKIHSLYSSFIGVKNENR